MESFLDLKFSLVAILLFTAISCAPTVGRFEEPSEAESSAATIHVIENLGPGFLKSDSVYVEGINHRGPPFWWTGTKPLRIPAGELSLDLAYHGGMGMFGLQRGTARFTYNFNAQPGKHYEIRATRHGDAVSFQIYELGAQRFVVPGPGSYWMPQQTLPAL